MSKITLSQKSSQPDFILAGTLVSLLLIGVLVLATASIPYSLKIAGNPNHFLFKQLASGLIGLIAGFMAYKLSLEKVKKTGIFFFFVALVLMFSVFLPIWGQEAKGATRWINLGFFSFQPSELLKITSILYLANLVSKLKKKSFWPFSAIIAVIAFVLLLQSDLSTLAIICATGGVIYFCGQAPLRNIFLMGLAGLLFFASFILIEPYRMQRIESLFNHNQDVLGAGYHPQQALISIGSGEITGSGLGLSVQKFGFLPESINDSIFAIYAEETGFAGCLLLLFLFLLFAQRAFSIAKKASDPSSKLIACGIGFWITSQAFINMGSMSGILPVTGIPLPFISAGGSHLIVELTAMGMLLNISKNL
ncbi:MAG: putative lipid II flippase FtsW [Candidatus Pacebacteria bacterium]|nr:putative lipid II flippase FtsW [Candidatus Paceibacterota bacterium]MDD4874827.1 putative lipid II flippase FtsW [Candidatus Paceibacterota bacterium]